jgi:predicted permease
MTSLVHDVKYALRTLRKSPGFSVVAVTTLALGIGANAAIFALVDRVMLRLLPVRNPRELVLLRSPGPARGHTWSDGDDAASFSFPMYRDLRERATVFSGLAAEYPFAVSLSSAGSETERAAAELASGNYFSVLGVAADVGRTLTPNDDRTPGASPVVVLSHGFWTRRFGSDPAILNKTIVVNGAPLTVVGVARTGFAGIQPGRPADLFVPLMMKAQMTPFWNGLDDPKDYWLQLIGRIKPGMSRASAEKALQPVYRPLLQALSLEMKGTDATWRRRFENRRLLLTSGGHGRTPLQDDVGTPLLSLMGMVALVLMIACSNLAGLLAARGAARQREYGIRLAIGASRFQIVRQSIVECLLYSVLGGALGLLVAGWTLHVLLEAFPADADIRQVAVHVDPRVLGFAAFASVLSGLLFGIAPALRAARLDPARTLRGQGRGTVSAGADVLRFRQWLVTAQVALTLVLLVIAGLFVDSLRNLGRVELGLKPDHVIGFSIAPQLNGYTPDRSGALARGLTDRLAGLPGVTSVAAAEVPTLSGDTVGGDVRIDGAEPLSGDASHARLNRIGPNYFATLGIPLLLGRELTWQDDASAPQVAVVNEVMARRFFGRKNPIGSKFAYGKADPSHLSIEIVGVVANSKSAEVAEHDSPCVYLPYLQDPKLSGLTFYVRSAQGPETLAATLGAEVRRLDANLPIFALKTLESQIRDSLVTQRLIVLLSAAFGGLAALLAAIGIYGVLAFAVAERRQEIAVRVALGANPGSVRALILKDVSRFLVIGAAIGLPAAYAVGRAVSSILFGVGATDVRVFGAGLAVMAIVAFAAAYPPARRASQVNAMEALRGE